MKILIVDDEPPARRGLRQLLKKIGVDEVREAGSVEQAVSLLKEERADLLLLDIEMPRAAGFELLETLPARGIPFIFVTAHSEHAAKAFDLRAVDYLLKPVAKDRLLEALSRVGSPESNRAVRFSKNDKVLFRDGRENLYLTIGEIVWLETCGSYTKVVTLTGKSAAVNGTLTGVLERLDEREFFRANRSQGINLSYIKSVEDMESGMLCVVLHDGKKIEFSRRQSIEFRRRQSI
jgi:two-component system LytT family response regulator